MDQSLRKTNFGIPGISVKNDVNPEISQRALNRIYILVPGLPEWFVSCVKLHNLDSYVS